MAYDEDWSLRDDLDWGLYLPCRRCASDQIPMLVTSGKTTLDFKGNKAVWVKNSKVDMTKRQFTLQLLLFYEKFDIEAPDNQPYIKPLLVFSATPEGYDKNNKNWEGDVTNAPGLDREELKSYDPRCDVVFSRKAWMSRQVCRHDVQRILDAIGDENILLQLPSLA